MCWGPWRLTGSPEEALSCAAGHSDEQAPQQVPFRWLSLHPSSQLLEDPVGPELCLCNHETMR